MVNELMLVRKHGFQGCTSTVLALHQQIEYLLLILINSSTRDWNKGLVFRTFSIEDST